MIIVMISLLSSLFKLCNTLFVHFCDPVPGAMVIADMQEKELRFFICIA